MKTKLFRTLLWCAFLINVGASEPVLETELIFPPEHWHCHASCVVEALNGDLIACWFQGSGERTANDVKIEGARLRKGSKMWERFTLADTPNYPDTNPTMFIDPQQRLWLLWPTILANEWHTALMKYRISSDYQKMSDAPRWEVNEVLHVTPGPEFEATVAEATAAFELTIRDLPFERQKTLKAFIEGIRKNAAR